MIDKSSQMANLWLKLTDDSIWLTNQFNGQLKLIDNTVDWQLMLIWNSSWCTTQVELMIQVDWRLKMIDDSCIVLMMMDLRTYGWIVIENIIFMFYFYIYFYIYCTYISICILKYFWMTNHSIYLETMMTEKRKQRMLLVREELKRVTSLRWISFGWRVELSNNTLGVGWALANIYPTPIITTNNSGQNLSDQAECGKSQM